MRRIMLLALVVASGVVAGAVVLGSASAARTSRALSLAPQLRALERRFLKPAPSPRVKRAVHARALNAPPAQPPRSRGFACPVAATSPCSGVPCVVYVGPATVRRLVTPRRPQPCQRKDVRQIPVMAR